MDASRASVVVRSAFITMVGIALASVAVHAAALSRIPFESTGFGSDGDESGTAVAFSGDAVAVGSPAMQVFPIADSGAVEVFRRIGGIWQSEAVVTPLDPGLGHRFGVSAALSGDTLVVGASGCCAVSSIYTFARTGGTWSQVDKMALPAGAEPAMALSGDTLILGGGTVFIRNGPGWTQQAQFVGDQGPFPSRVAIDGDRAIVGDQEATYPGDDFGPQ